MPWPCSRLGAGPLVCTDFLYHPGATGESAAMLFFGSHQKQRVPHNIAGGKPLAWSRIYSDLLVWFVFCFVCMGFLSPFCLYCPLHFEFSGTATQAAELSTSEPITFALRRKRYYRSSLRVDSQKEFLLPCASWEFSMCFIKNSFFFSLL